MIFLVIIFALLAAPTLVLIAGALKDMLVLAFYPDLCVNSLKKMNVCNCHECHV